MNKLFAALFALTQLMLIAGPASADPVAAADPGLDALSAATGGGRLMLSSEEQGAWPAVGRLNVSGQGFCTATLIEPTVVLTAAHCVYDKRTGRPVRADRVHFLAGYRLGAFAAHGRAARIVMAPEYLAGLRTIQDDLAVILLKEPMPAVIVPIVTATDMQDADSLYTLSYGIDRSQALARQTGCGVAKRRGALVLTSCEGVPGVSGAPVLRRDAAGRPQLVAVGAAMMMAGKRPVLPRGRLLAVGLSDDVLDGMIATLAEVQLAANF